MLCCVVLCCVVLCYVILYIVYHISSWYTGAFYWADIFMRFRMGFCVVYNLKRELIMDGGLIAHFYVRHDTFLTDVVAACPAIAEVRLL